MLDNVGIKTGNGKGMWAEGVLLCTHTLSMGLSVLNLWVGWWVVEGRKR